MPFCVADLPWSELGQDGAMLDDPEDDPTKNKVFRTAVWIVLALVAIGLVLTLVLS